MTRENIKKMECHLDQITANLYWLSDSECIPKKVYETLDKMKDILILLVEEENYRGE